MKDVFRGTLEVVTVDRGCQEGTRGRCILTVPAAAVEAAGFVRDGHVVRLKATHGEAGNSFGKSAGGRGLPLAEADGGYARGPLPCRACASLALHTPGSGSRPALVLALFRRRTYVVWMDEDIKLQLRWRQTWDDRENDFAADAPGYSGSVCRIYIQTKPGGLESHWFWSMTASGHFISRSGRNSGYEDTPRRAARAAEEAYFLAVRGTELEHVPPPEATVPVNAYAAAKGR